MSSALVLGTAQLGFAYGIANKAGQPDQALATEIVRSAWEAGITEFDTAQDYGESEEVLGRAFAALGIAGEARVVSKLDPALDHCDPRAVSRALDATLRKLGVPALSGLMLHDENLLSRWPRGVGDAIRGLVASGRVAAAGVSVYSPEKACEALCTEGIDLVQVPSNILDGRFFRKGVFALAAEKKKRVYIRSVFLQGLLLMDPDGLPAHMAHARPVLERVKALAEDLGVTRHTLALGYLRAKAPEAKLVIGVDAPAQIRENVSRALKETADDLVSPVEKSFANVDEKIINPSLWRT
ncbi:aldo/keto reductase [Thermodesulfobacteriota bacterium]